MANPWHHAVSSSKKFGGSPEQYLEVHRFMDCSKQNLGDFRHRAVLHHTLGIFIAEKVFGPTLTIVMKDGVVKQIPTRWVAEQHVQEDCGRIPTVEDWLRNMSAEPWMVNAAKRLSKEID